MSRRVYRPIIDWLKGLGIILIILGHLAGSYTNQLTPPVYPKQLGVAFFVFALGYSLAMESRSRAEVVFNRLFEMFLWGLATAFVVTWLTYLRSGSLAGSNYLPFALGANVVVNDFPANPTTWYIGTYIHLLLLWVLVRNVRLSGLLMGGVILFGIGCRYLLSETAGPFVAYMAFPNWVAVLAAGLWAGQKDWSPRWPRLPLLACLVVFGIAGYYVVWPLVSEPTFPFMVMSGSSRLVALLWTSCLVSILYLGWTLVTCLLFWQITPPVWIRFLARNTLLVFIAHMPVFYRINPLLRSAGFSYPARSIIEIIICLLGLALVSEVLHRTLPIAAWRESVRKVIIRSQRYETEAPR